MADSSKSGANYCPSIFKGFLKRKVKKKSLLRYMKGIIFYGRYTKGVPFPSKKVYKWVRAWTSGRSPPV